MYNLRTQYPALKKLLGPMDKLQVSLFTFKFHEQSVVNSAKASTFLIPVRGHFSKNYVRRRKNDPIESEDIVVNARQDPDKFGTLSYRQSYDNVEGDKGDEVEENYITYPLDRSRALRISQYADLIKSHLKKKELGAAIDVLETKLLKVDGAKPDGYIYALLIGACGRYGYNDKAFKLYNQMKERDIKVPLAVYTGLFNSCANSPFPEKALKNTKHLRELMVEKSVQFNATHYHAMIKAFGRCNDTAAAFEVVDEMVDQKVPITSETFNFLLQACITNKEEGFRYALLVWRKMVQKKVKPDKFSFNLILRCTRDCSIGDTNEFQKLVESFREKMQYLAGETAVTNLPIDTTDQLRYTNNCSEETSIIALESEYPNLLDLHPDVGNIISLKNVTTSKDRLMFLGGYKGFVNFMKHYGETPDIKTYTLLLDSIPSSVVAEMDMLSAMKINNIYPDIDFFNMLIRKRTKRQDYRNARDVLNLIHDAKLAPNILTFGTLALCCTTKKEAEELIFDMRKAGYRLNVEILGAMLSQACSRYDFNYTMKVLYVAVEEEIKLDLCFYDTVDSLLSKSRALLKNKDTLRFPGGNRDMFLENFKVFIYRHKAWLKRSGGREAVIDEHPWKQFKRPSQSSSI